MRTNLKTKEFQFRPINNVYSRLTPVETQTDGVLSYSCVYQEYNSCEMLSKYKSSDYSLGNLIQIGSFGGLSYVSMSLNSDMNFVDEFAKTFSENATPTV